MNNKYGRELLRILLNNSLLRVVLYFFYFMRFGFYVIKERSFLFLRYYPGYHGSTIPSMKFILNNCDSIFVDAIDEPDGIQMNERVQISLAEDFVAHYGDFSPPAEKSSDCLYFYKNNMFGFNDGFALYSFIRKYCPKRIVEIGSGFSSALMIDTCDKFNHTAELTFVDPWSINVLDVIKSNKSNLTVNYLRKEIQLIDLSLFGSLDANDIVFIDTSHALKIGSDLSFIFYKILPLLRIGVIVHIHDIWYPFEYPRSMVLEGRIYNEAYFVRSFLQFNKSFEILFFGSFLELRHKNIFDQMPGYFKDSGKSLWLRRNA